MAGDLRRYYKIQRTFPGFFSPFAARCFQYFLEHQQRDRIAGDILEIGVYRGKSAIFLAHFLRPEAGERLIACDLFGSRPGDPEMVARGDRQQFLASLERFFPLHPWLTLVAAPSAELERHYTGKRVRWVHIDGDHRFEPTFQDLLLAERLILPEGVVVLDDLYNHTWPGVAQAFFAYLARSERRLAPFLEGFNKVYLCDRSRHRDCLALAGAPLAERLRRSGLRGFRVIERACAGHPMAILDVNDRILYRAPRTLLEMLRPARD